MARRGSYAKGVAKREEILRTALEVVAREGYRGASVRELADAVGLSQAGLLHYFGTKEELFTAILRTRDDVDSQTYYPDPPRAADVDLVRTYLDVIRHNSEVPGMVQLFSRMAVDGADPAHPAHDYFLERGEMLRAAFTPSLQRLQESGALTDRISPETLARVLQALSDGLQLQWMLDPSIDMAGTVGALLKALTVEPEPGQPDTEEPAP